VSAAVFEQCSFKNLGLTPLCTLGSKEKAGGIYPQMWGSSVIDQYKSAKRGKVPEYIKTEVATNKRNFVNNAQVCTE
jgi:hypothetical protein